VDLPRAGTWAIDGWVRTEQSSLAQNVQFRFKDATGATRSTMASLQTGQPGGWSVNVDGVLDGAAYPFNKGRVYVTVYGNNNATAQTIQADALRFRYIGPLAEVTDWLYF
jgi:hypothetical protein